MAPQHVPMDVWMSPCGGGSSTDWSAFEKMLDGVSKVPEEEHREEYWGKGTAAHFWGSDLKPVRRVIANVVKVNRGDDWKTMSLNSQKDADAKDVYRKKLTVDRWPQGAPMQLDSNRVLGAIVAPRKSRMVVAGAVSMRGLYIAPLSVQQKEDVRKAAHDDFLSSTGCNTVVTNLRSTGTGTRVTFHVDTSKAEAKSVLDKIKMSLPKTKVTMLSNLYASFGIRPSDISPESSKCQVVVREMPWVRGDPATGQASAEDLDLGSKIASGSAARTAPSRATASRPATTAPSSTRPSTTSKPVVSGSIKRMPAPSSKPAGYTGGPDPSKATSPAERKKALLGKVMHKTKVQLTKIEAETPHVLASHEVAQRKEAITAANIKLAQKQGVSNAAKEQAKLNLKPPSTWLGALKGGKGGKVIENFELSIVDFVRETMSLVGRARIQSGKLDVTYQAKVRVLAKDNELVVEIVLDSSGVCRGTFTKPGQISGNFHFPNGDGTFKLMRVHTDD